MKYLYWYQGKTNVGDVASYIVVSSVCREKIMYKSPKTSLPSALKRCFLNKRFKMAYYREIILPFQKCLMAIGSILDYSNSHCIIWGTGFREYTSKYSQGQVYAVRGRLSKEKLPQTSCNVKIGDPAILLPLLFKIQKKPNVIPKLCLIPHYYDFENVRNIYSSRYDILDVRTNDVKGFITRLCNYDYVLSSSLHGLIIAHSYGIPAIWFYYGDIKSGSFKFHDYFSSVGVPLYEGFRNIDEILQDSVSWKVFFEQHKELYLPHIDITKLQFDLLSCFPFPKQDWCVDFLNKMRMSFVAEQTGK